MSRMYDRMFWCPVAHGYSTETDRDYRLLREDMRKCIVVVADNVADYMHLTYRHETQWRPTIFPAIAPPAPCLWVEYRASPSVMGEEWVAEHGRPCRYGHLMMWWSDDSPGWTDILDGLDWQPELFDGVRWLLGVETFTEIRGAMYWRFTAVLLVKDDGTLSDLHYVWGPATEIYGNPIGMLSSGLMSVCFMHCKNVVLERNDPPEKLSRAHQKRHGKPLVRYHTLNIEPMKEILRREGGAETNGLQRALHICRGHFATYSPERPLFGKHAGTFWVPMHTRGRTSEGVVVKDYEVKIPIAQTTP